jgi:nucleotide-binding universal stress UspA family protein
MADTVLVGFDGSEQSRAALTYAAEEWNEAAFTLLYVINPTAAGYASRSNIPSAAEEWYEDALADAERTLAQGVDLVRETVVGSIETDTAVGRPATEIVEYAEGHDVDHLVVGSHGRTGVSRLLLGSNAEKVVRRSPVPVTVVR